MMDEDVAQLLQKISVHMSDLVAVKHAEVLMRYAASYVTNEQIPVGAIVRWKSGMALFRRPAYNEPMVFLGETPKLNMSFKGIDKRIIDITPDCSVGVTFDDRRPDEKEEKMSFSVMLLPRSRLELHPLFKQLNDRLKS